MTEEPKRKGRGKGVKPALAHVNLRVSKEVLDYYKRYPSFTVEMRRVLTEHANKSK